MEDENEVLDWGNEDDEQLDPVARRSDADEDAVSLGDDDDDQEFYPYQRSPPSGPHPGHQARESESRGRSPRPGNYQDYRSGRSRDRHREGSSSSYRRSARREPDSPQPHGTASYSPRRRSHSFSSHNAPARLTHALPPKPVVSTVPYLPSHPSVVEATAMSNRARDSKKGNGAPSNGKPVSSGQETDLPLPPHWEVRIPRNGRGVYYYNTLTEESTWDHPSDLTPNKIAQEDEDVDSSRQQEPVATAAATNSSLSYQDRHYRPVGEPDAAPGNNRRPEGGLEGSDTQVFISSTPPRSPRRARSLSPSQIESAPPPRIRDNGDSRPPRGAYRSSRTRPEAANFDAPPQRDRDIPSDAVYDREHGGRDRRGRPAPQEGKDYREDGERGHPRRQYRQQYSENLAFSGPPEDRERPPVRRGGGYVRGRDRDPSDMIEPRESGRSQNQNLSMPTFRHRSPPPRMRDDSGYDDARQRQLPPSGASGPPGSMSRKGRSSRYDQPTDDGRPQASTVPPSNASYSQHRDAEVDEPSYSRRPVDRDYDRSSRDAAERPPVTQRTHSSRTDAYVSRSRDDYREDTDIHPPPGRGRVSPIDDRGGPSRRRRGPLPPQESSFEDSRQPPVGPDYREGHHISPVQSRRPTMDAPPDSGASEVPSGPRVRPPPLDTSFDRGRPPPGPGSAGYDRSRRNKWNDRRASATYEPTSPGDAMDIDRDQGPRSGARFPPSPAVRSAEQRHPSSTFPDAADAPKGPRAMNKPYGGSGPSGPPEYSHGSGRPRERSPPPHMTGDRSGNRREYDGGRPGGGHVWRERGYVHPADRSGPPFSREPRGRPPPPKAATGTNDIPVGVRRRGASADAPRNFSPPRYEGKFYNNRQASSGGPGAPRDLAPGKESYERPPHMDIAPPPPYRSNRYDNAPERDRPGDPMSSSSQPYSRRPSGPPPHGPSRTRQPRKSRFETGGFDSHDQPMRSWGPHENSPPREHGGQYEREATPPPLSREPSAAATSPAWESAQGDQPPPVVEESIRSAPPPRPMDVDIPVPAAPAAPAAPVVPVAPIIPVVPEAKVDRPPFPPPPPFFGLPPPSVPMVKDVAKAKVEVPVPPVVPVPPPVTTLAPVPGVVPAQPAPSAALTSPADTSGEKSRVSSDTRKRSSRWGERTSSSNADSVPQPVAEKEQETSARFQRQPEMQESYAPKSYPRRSFTNPQQPSNDESSGNSFNPSSSYPRDRDGSRYNRHEHQQQLSERIETQRPELNRRGASLLDRLGDTVDNTHPQSLRDRVQIPSKRDRDDGGGYDDRFENSYEDDGGDFKRMKRRPGRMNHPTFNRRGGRRGGPP